MMIWVDADACPKAARELIARALARLRLPVRLVANRPLPAIPSPRLAKLARSAIEVVQVSASSDVAGSYIVQHVAAGDLVVLLIATPPTSPAAGPRPARAPGPRF